MKKPSELLKEGSKQLDEQIRGAYLVKKSDGKLCGCALGAIALGAGYKPEFSGSGNLVNEYDIQEVLVKEALPEPSRTLGDVLMWNDHNVWSFDLIIKELQKQGL